ncbi:hypothetical protein VTL71DRAFT_10789 [Oculimacula yallundae]|uniref:Uncharacterized protein n=1 Tax=Oculimacula yallundae TaxID=86028 RepID=A0ABR4CUE0_9HELO
MDPVRQSQASFDNLLVAGVNYSDVVFWVEAAWRLEDAVDISQDRGGDWMDALDVSKFIWRTMRLHRAQKSRQSTSSKDSSIVEERADIRSSSSWKSYKCGLGCNTPAFKWPKDLRRHMKDIYEIRARYRLYPFSRALVAFSSGVLFLPILPTIYFCGGKKQGLELERQRRDRTEKARPARKL